MVTLEHIITTRTLIVNLNPQRPSKTGHHVRWDGKYWWICVDALYWHAWIPVIFGAS